MLLHLASLYRRYITHHLSLRVARLDLPGLPAAEIWLRRGRIMFDGPEAILDHGGARAEGLSPSLPFAPGAAIRVSLRNHPRTAQELPALPAARLVLAHLALWPGLAGRVLALLPLLPGIRDPHLRARARRRLGLEALPPAPRLHLRPDPAPLTGPKTGIAILLPVHDAAEHVARCLDRIARMTDLPWRLVIVEDGSTDPGLRPMLADWVARQASAEMICHDTPRGFAGAVNAGLARLGAVQSPVVLLNSDVTLPAGWASRLVAPLLADRTIASVTPLSNEGELMGAPHACAGVALRNGEADAIDAALAPLARAGDLPILPTGTGFCMALAPQWLAQVLRFDEGFGRGYGEEVDWCQRIRALGGRHLCQTGLYVGHVGAASFGTDQRRILRAKSVPVLSRRYPRFDSEVAQVLADDPLVAERLRAGLLWVRARLGEAPLPLYLSHSLGGGTARWLEQRLASHEGAVVLRVGGARRWQLELHSPAGVTRGATDRFSDILTLLRYAGSRHVSYLCAVGDPAPEEIPVRLLDLCAGGQGLEVMFHDYFPLCRDYTFRSETDPGWQALWRRALERAETVTVFSDASRRIVAGVHPDLAHKIVLRPHAPLGPVPRLTPPPAGQPVIGIAGHLNAQKGAAVVAALARHLGRSREARIVVLGAVAPDCRLPRSVRVVGGYARADLPHLAARHGIGLWLIPSVWPESFSYVTQEALMTGLPCLGFDLGGQGEALRAAGNGHVVALRNDPPADAATLLAVLRSFPEWGDGAAGTGLDRQKIRSDPALLFRARNIGSVSDLFLRGRSGCPATSAAAPDTRSAPRPDPAPLHRRR